MPRSSVLQPWNVRAAQQNQKPVEPQESGEQNSGPGVTPKPDTSTVNHNTIGCKLVNGRRNGIVHCGRAGNWGDEDMANLAAHIAKKRTVPIVGKRAQIVQLNASKVRRLNIEGNAEIKNAETLKDVLKRLPNLLELNISNTGLFGLTKDTISENKVLGHISMQGRARSACVDFELFLQLNANLAKGNKFIFFA